MELTLQRFPRTTPDSCSQSLFFLILDCTSKLNGKLDSFQYETVSQYKDDCGAFECHLYTDYVQVSLRNLSDGKETTVRSISLKLFTKKRN